MSALQNFWKARNDSEKRTLSIAAIALALCLAWLLIVQPLRSKFASMQADVLRLDQSLAEIERLMPLHKTLGSTPVSTATDTSLTALIDQKVRALNLQSGLKSIAPQENGQVSIELGGANFDVLMHMLEQLETERGVRVVEMSIETLGSSTVNAKLSLSQ
jgi:type II secretory pathway component PulM